jgi:hypothetical protein
MNKLKWFFVTNYGRYALGVILTVIGAVFSPEGTIEFLNTEYDIFNYILTAGVLTIVGQFAFHVIMAVYLNTGDRK